MATVAAIALPTALAASPSLLGANVQRLQGRKAETAQNKANDVQQASASVEASRRRRQAVAKARIVRAQNTASGISQGISATSSPVAGANASVTSTLAGNVASANRSVNTAQQTFGLRQDAQNSLRRGQQLADYAAIPGAALGTAATAQQVLT